MTRLFLLSFLIINIFAIELHCQVSDEELISAILHDHTDIVKRYFKLSNDPNRQYGNQKIVLLHFSIQNEKLKIADVLLNAGADINLLFENETPLMTAIKFNLENSIIYLIQKGADVDKQNIKGQTAAIQAARYNNSKILEVLVTNKANLEIRDKYGRNAIDYAYFLQNINAYKYLSSVKESKYDKIHLPNYFDGPYVFKLDNSRIKVSYFYNDSVLNEIFRKDSLIDLKNKNVILNNPGQYFDIPIMSTENYIISKNKYTNVKKLMAIGDIHGGFIELRNFLIANNIIDSTYSWNFGDGHLIMLGDIFDRGDMVTECFWLLYKLEKEAVEKGGMVHVILGNHEIMELSGDKRYLGYKYLAINNKLRQNYTDLYSKNTELGSWLRTKNTVIEINNILFVHGGLSVQIVDQKLNIGEINDMVQNIISREEIIEKNKTEELILGENGPFWYRGYLKPDEKYYKDLSVKYDFDEKKLDKILNFYKVTNIIFANTNVYEVKPLFNNKLIGIDIPFEEAGVFLQGLYYEKGIFYKALKDGSHEVIK